MTGAFWRSPTLEIWKTRYLLFRSTFVGASKIFESEPECQLQSFSRRFSTMGLVSA